MKKVRTTTFQELVTNAVDFLGEAVRDLKRDRPKYSVINFCAAIELFLKARLLHEHWTLVVTKSEPADLQNFESGGFKSVTVEESIDRLARILQDPLTEHERACFKTLRDTRNRFVHFIDTSTSNSKVKEAVAFTELQAWHFIYRRLTITWAAYFGKFAPRLKTLDKQVKTMASFTKAKFAAVSPEIAAEKKGGVEFKRCSICKQVAAKVEKTAGNLYSVRCLVCERPWQEHFLREKCEKCGAEIDYEGEQQECAKCETIITPESLLEKYGPNYDPKDPDPHLYYCGNCENETAIYWENEKWLCLNCLSLYDEVSHCGHCSTPITGSGEDTSLMGCFMCEGPSFPD